MTSSNIESLADFLALLDEHVADGSALRIALGHPVGSTTLQKVSLRPVELKEGERWQLAIREDNRERHENLEPGTVAERVGDLFGSDFRRCHLHTIAADFEAKFKGERLKVQQRKPSLTAPPTTEHNREKRYYIPEGTPCRFLEEIGVMNPNGTVRSSRSKKFRQINHFLETVADIYGHLPKEGTVSVVDFGCGKSYLTFALHHFLTQIKQRTVEIVGLDRKSEVIRDCRRIAGQLRCEGLSFQSGDLVEYTPPGEVHLCVALHACDTATDAGLAQAVAWNTDVILAAPCCQHEVFASLKAKELSLLTTHGVLKERFSALATDALRARLLELVGYSAKVQEFIEVEHTPKNLLLRAIRRDRPRKTAEQEKWTQRYEDFKQLLGLETFAFEEQLRTRGLWNREPVEA